MKKIFISVGVAALGAAGFQSAVADSVASPKYWNVSATLRGFYDDNYNISGNDKGSAGVELSPSVSFHVPLQQTDMGIRYTYGLYYYQDRQDLGVNAFDQTHQFDLWLDHAFNQNWHVKVNDTFAIGQEPELLNGDPSLPNPIEYRINGDNLSNHGSIALNTDWTRLFSTSLTYDNSFYNYDDDGTKLGTPPSSLPLSGIAPNIGGLGMPGWMAGYNSLSAPNGQGASLAGILDRVEEDVSLDLKWHIQPETTAFIGYQFSWVNYTGDEPIAIVNAADVIVFPTTYATANPRSYVYHSSDRDNVTHYGYVGIEHQFTANLGGTVRGGASYTDNYADPLYSSTSWSPYADLSLTYTYLPGSYAQLGFTHDIGATDQVTPDNSGHLTQFSENSVVYADINHRFTSKLSGMVIGRVQYSTFEGGYASSADETSYSLGLNLTYQINRHFSVDGGYNYDNLSTDLVGYSYTRNRVYLGVSANY